MKISIEIKLPNERIIFICMLILQIIGASLGISNCADYTSTRCILNGVLTIIASLIVGIGCFWQQQEDLAFFSLDHAHRATTLLVLMLLTIASSQFLYYPEITILILDGLYILSSISLAVTHRIRNEL